MEILVISLLLKNKGVLGMKEKAQVKVEGVFDVQRFYDTLAMILSSREGVKITVKVTEEPKEKKKETA